MNSKAIIKILGVFLSFFSITMIVPIVVASLYQEHDTMPFWMSFFMSLGVGLILWLPTRHCHLALKTRDGFLIVVLFWSVLSLFAAIPFIIDTHPHVTFVDALFESVSGFTTTGANLLPNLDQLPHALLYYRQQLQFIGGMGIIVLGVAIMPMIGVGGMQLYRAETPGPMKEDKLTPRIAQTAKIIWLFYVSLCLICAIAYWLCGMSLFDAICESFATVSTGGYTIHDSSFAFYHHPSIRIIGMIFMLLGAINFSLHYFAVIKGKFSGYIKNLECRVFLLIVLILATVIIVVLVHHHYYPSLGVTMMNSFFNTISIITTTGFNYDAYDKWPTFTPFLLMLFGIIGACGGSTSGGLKMIRVLVLEKQVSREVKQLIHPQGIYPLKIGQKLLSKTIIESIWAFMTAYFTLFVIIVILLMATGIDFKSAFGATVATLSNVGAGIGTYAYDFSHMTSFAKYVCVFSMLSGRLEVFTLLVIFSKSFWQR